LGTRSRPCSREELGKFSDLRVFCYDMIRASPPFGARLGYNQIRRSWSDMTLKEHHVFDACLIAALLILCGYLMLLIFSRLTLP